MISCPAKSFRIAVAGASVLLMAAAASAQVNHGDVLGLNVDFLQVTETTRTGGDPATLYGAPIAETDAFAFAPASFVSTCTSGGSDATASEVTTDIRAHAGATLQTVVIAESGDATLSASPPPGTASTNASASLSGTLTVVEDSSGPIVPVVIPFSATFMPAASFALPASAGTSDWSANATIDVASNVPGATRATLTWNNSLTADCAAGSTSASNQKNGASVSVAVEGGIATPTSTQTPSSTATATATPAPALEISGGVSSGSTRVFGSGAPRPTPNSCVQVCQAVVPSMPSVPPCTGADSVLGTGGTDASGAFVDGGSLGIPLAAPLVAGQCVYAHDQCTMQRGDVVCIVQPAPAPVLSWWGWLAAGAALLWSAFSVLRRTHRSAG